MQLEAGAGEIFRLGHGDKVPEMAQFHVIQA
jgi:hypothetical protein